MMGEDEAKALVGERVKIVRQEMGEDEAKALVTSETRV